MADTPSSRPPPLPPIRHCSACNAAVLDGERRCSRCGYTTADPVPPFPLDERRKTPSGFPLPAIGSTPWDSPGDPVSDIQAALEPWEGSRKYPQTPDERAAFLAGRDGKPLPNPFAGLPVPPISQETLRAARSPDERLAAARRIKAGVHAAAEHDFVRIATRTAPYWWLGPVRSRDRYKRRELFHHAAACVATLALGALFAIGLFGWFAK